jgi:hypothetical protein
MSAKAGGWIDHKQATIVLLSDHREESREVTVATD